MSRSSGRKQNSTKPQIGGELDRRLTGARWRSVVSISFPVEATPSIVTHRRPTESCFKRGKGGNSDTPIAQYAHHVCVYVCVCACMMPHTTHRPRQPLICRCDFVRCKSESSQAAFVGCPSLDTTPSYPSSSPQALHCTNSNPHS